MSISKEEVLKVAKLARIALNDEETDLYQKELNSILNWVEQLSEVNTDSIEPLSSVIDTPLPLRIDEVTDGGIAKEILANAPEELENFFVVPKVVE